jgi:TolB-like protein
MRVVHPTPSRPRRSRLLCVVALLAAALPGGAGAQATATPSNVEKLEAARAKDPRSAAALRTLGVAYYRAGRYDDARRTLEEARALARTDGTVALYLGMSAEQRGDLPAARAAYTDYLEHGRTRSVKRQVRARLLSLKRQELEQAAKATIAQEEAIATQPGSPTTVAVPPLRFSGADSTLVPLERGFADLLITDLGRSTRLTVLERDRIQSLVDEIARSQSARADSATALRSGRMLRAGRVVQGSLTQLPDRTLRVDAAVVDVPTTQSLRTVQRSDVLEQLFAIEKQVAFDIFEALGVTLTPAERALVEQRPTRSIAAFLAYSAGLMAEDAGNLEDAERHYANAVRLDPNFRAAREKREAIEAERATEVTTLSAMEATLTGTTEGLVATAADRGTVAPESRTGPELTMGGTLTTVINDLNPSPLGDATGGGGTPTRDPASSTTGTDNPAGGTGRIRIIVPQPAPRRTP